MTPDANDAKPTHGGVFNSPLPAWPGWFALPDPDTFTEEHSDKWLRCLEQAAAAGTQRIQDIAAALFILECGEWHIQNMAVETLAIQASARKAPLKIRRWVGRRVAEYINDINDPKG